MVPFVQRSEDGDLVEFNPTPKVGVPILFRNIPKTLGIILNKLLFKYL
jgi:hypothetical protein